ncbi:MAG: hypothetical protein HOW73_20980 [Polyangiaceae bacterium]|nr:hypothetical protein [Polyangiaceae bacterium]
MDPGQEDAPRSTTREATAVAPRPDDAPESELVTLRRKPMWPFFAVVAAILAVVGGVIYWFSTRPDPFKVLVAVDVDGQWWEGSRAAAILSDQIGEGLKRIGFEPVSGGDPDVDKVLSSSKTPEEAARRLRAGFLITGSLSPQILEHRLGDDGGAGKGLLVEARSDAKLSVRFVGDDEGKAKEVPALAFGYGDSKDAALAMLVDRIAERVFDGAVPALLEHPAIRSQLDQGDVEATLRLKDAKQYADLRARRISEATKAYAKADQDHAEQPSAPFSISYHGSFSEQSYLAAAGPDRALLRTADIAPFVHPTSMELVWSYRLETLSWRPKNGDDHVVWTGYHVLGIPSASADGSTIALVEDLYAQAKTISVIREGAEPRRLRVDPRARFDDLLVSGAGSYVAYYERPCRQCGANITVSSLADGKSPYARIAASQDLDEAPTEIYYGFSWLDDRQLVIALRDARPPPTPEPSEGETGEAAVSDDPKRGGEEVRVIDVGKSPPLERLVVQLDTDRECHSPDASPDGKRVAMTCDGRLALFDAMSGEEVLSTEVGGDPTWSPKGDRIAFVRGGDIYLMSVSDQRVTQLTNNEFGENRPRFSPDGRRVYFQSQQDDPNIGSRIASVIASVEVP